MMLTENRQNTLDYVKAALCCLFLLPTLLALRLVMVVVGIILLPFIILYCQYKQLEKFPKLFWIWDNEEDGYTGNQRGNWYDVYLDGKDTTRPRGVFGYTDVSFWTRFKRSYIWSAIRNPANNMQRTEWVSWKVDIPDKVSLKTWNKGRDWVIAYKPEKGIFWHLCVSLTIFKRVRFRFGLKLKPWYYNAEDYTLDDYRGKTTYTISLFKE